MHHRPTRLIDAVWQRFAEESAGLIACVRCPAPDCGRWFPKNSGRSDRQFCCHACQMRAWRKWPVGRGWLNQARTYAIPFEIIIVEWNPLPDRPRLAEGG